MKINNNCHVDGNKVISYKTHVATIDGEKLLVHGRWSHTTSTHINLVAKQYGLTKVDAPPDEKKDDENPLRSIAAIAMMGEIFGTTKKEKNHWKARMIKAGMENRGLIMPDDWDSLSEDEKEKRLNGVIAVLTEKPTEKKASRTTKKKAELTSVELHLKAEQGIEPTDYLKK